jgi:NADH:ubiquinone oxidoreductase subunit 6 (subunit J)
MSIIYLTAIGVFTTYTIVVLQYIQYTIDEGRGDTLFNFGAYISFITLAFVVFTVAPFAYLLFKKKKVSIKNENNNSFNKKFVGNENKILTGYLP